MMKRCWLPFSIAAMIVALASPARAGRPPAEAANPELLGRPGEPGSGVGRIVEGGGDPNRLQAPLPRRPRNDDEAKAIEDLEEIFDRFDAAATATEDTLRDQLVIEAEKISARPWMSSARSCGAIPRAFASGGPR